MKKLSIDFRRLEETSVEGAVESGSVMPSAILTIFQSAWRVSNITDKAQVFANYFGVYANAYRGKISNASLEVFPLPMMEDELRHPLVWG